MYFPLLLYYSLLYFTTFIAFCWSQIFCCYEFFFLSCFFFVKGGLGIYLIFRSWMVLSPNFSSNLEKTNNPQWHHYVCIHLREKSNRLPWIKEWHDSIEFNSILFVYCLDKGDRNKWKLPETTLGRILKAPVHELPDLHLYYGKELFVAMLDISIKQAG